ncbi:hypothetical protein KSP40_PGU009194 [Platanthera guangdongensis]|uniref:Uncharacterized protein n=1 Tax=Platanthera guangdongensis TaxID=2320717 RepID=A0ABR2LDS8_9ASPA
MASRKLRACSSDTLPASSTRDSAAHVAHRQPTIELQQPATTSATSTMDVPVKIHSSSSRFNQKNEQYEDEYYDYEDDGIEDDANDDEEKVEEPKPNNDELEFLKEREKLKEKFREKLRKEENEQYFGHSSQSQEEKRTSTKYSFGSFFGPSQPAIAPRVLDLWRSMRETRHVTSKAPSSSSGRERCSSVASSEWKIYEHRQRTQVNEVKMKAKALKDMRDYSFLSSEDTNLPDKEPPPPASRHASAPRPLARSAQTPLESKIPIGRSLKSVSASRDMQTKVSTMEVQDSKNIPSLSEPRKSLSKAMPSKVPLKSNVVGQVMGTK